MRQPELTSAHSCHNLRATSEGEGDAQREAAQELEKDAYADAVSGSAGGWGWLHPAPKRDDAVAAANGGHDVFPITGDDYIAQMAAAAQTLKRYKRMLSEAQKILAAEQSSYESEMGKASKSTLQASESRVITQIERVTHLSARVGEESRRLQHLLDQQDLSPKSKRSDGQSDEQHPTAPRSFSAWQHQGAQCGVVVDVRSKPEFDEVNMQ